MDASAARFVGSVPEFYDRCMGPVIFAPYARDIARRAAGGVAARVLETAAGTGIVTRALRDELPREAELTATDLNLPMIEVARRKFESGERVRLEVADAIDLPYRDASFDTVVCQFGVMFYPDRPRSYREVRRVLQRGGRYLFSVWDSHRHNEFGRIACETVARRLPDDPPQFHRVPFGYADIDPIKESLLEAGFGDVRVAVVRIARPLREPAEFARGLVLGTPLAEQLRMRGADPESLIAEIQAAFAALAPRFSMQAIVFEAS